MHENEKVGEILPPASDWLAQYSEPVLEPELPIVDPHYHLWVMGDFVYMGQEFLADVNSGHNIVATFFLEAWASYRTDGPEELRCVGETEMAYAEGVKTGDKRISAGIIPYANLRRPDLLDKVLDAHAEAAHGRLIGIRDVVDWDEDPALKDARFDVPRDLMQRPEFRQGVRRLGERGLVCDIWAYFTQLEDLADLARACPDTKIVVNHCGAPTIYGQYVGRRDEVMAVWRRGIEVLATCPNVYMKLGGLGMRLIGFDFDKCDKPQSSEVLAEAWKPIVHPLIDLFGADRCMFESNFPVDKEVCTYVTLWNTFKRLSAGYSPAERDALMRKTALTVYGVTLPL